MNYLKFIMSGGTCDPVVCRGQPTRMHPEKAPQQECKQ